MEQYTSIVAFLSRFFSTRTQNGIYLGVYSQNYLILIHYNPEVIFTFPIFYDTFVCIYFAFIRTIFDRSVIKSLNPDFFYTFYTF